MENITVNEGKELIRVVDGTAYERYALQTKLIGKDDDMIDMVKAYALPHMQKGDILFMSEKAVACTQNRAIPLDEIKPGFLAKLLVKFVYRSPHGLGRTWVKHLEKVCFVRLKKCFLLAKNKKSKKKEKNFEKGIDKREKM